MTDMWEPGDFLPGRWPADFAAPMVSLKIDFYDSCDRCNCDCWVGWGSAMRWSADLKTVQPHQED